MITLKLFFLLTLAIDRCNGGHFGLTFPWICLLFDLTFLGKIYNFGLTFL